METQTGLTIFGVIVSVLALGVCSGVAAGVLLWRGASFKKIATWLIGLSLLVAFSWSIVWAYQHPLFDSYWETLRVNGIIAALLWLMYMPASLFTLLCFLGMKVFYEKAKGE